MNSNEKHLEIIQNVVNRMAGNSFLLKGWSLTLVAGLFALAASDSDTRIAFVALIPVLAFWGLDAYYLWQERLFRDLYDAVRNNKVCNYSMNTSDSDSKKTWRDALVSGTVFGFHGPLLAVAIVVAVLLHLFPLRAGAADTTNPGSNAKRDVEIGAILPLTGPAASYGQYAREGIDLALREIHARGGINGRPLRVEYQDDRAETKEAVNIMKRFTSVNRYPVVIGPAPSSSAVAIAPMAERAQTVLFTPIASSPDLTTKGGEYFFRVCPSDAFQARILAEWIASRKLAKHI